MACRLLRKRYVYVEFEELCRDIYPIWDRGTPRDFSIFQQHWPRRLAPVIDSDLGLPSMHGQRQTGYVHHPETETANYSAWCERPARFLFRCRAFLFQLRAVMITGQGTASNRLRRPKQTTKR